MVELAWPEVALPCLALSGLVSLWLRKGLTRLLGVAKCWLLDKTWQVLEMHQNGHVDGLNTSIGII